MVGIRHSLSFCSADFKRFSTLAQPFVINRLFYFSFCLPIFEVFFYLSVVYGMVLRTFSILKITETFLYYSLKCYSKYRINSSMVPAMAQQGFQVIICTFLNSHK